MYQPLAQRQYGIDAERKGTPRHIRRSKTKPSASSPARPCGQNEGNPRESSNCGFGAIDRRLPRQRYIRLPLRNHRNRPLGVAPRPSCRWPARRPWPPRGRTGARRSTRSRRGDGTLPRASLPSADRPGRPPVRTAPCRLAHPAWRRSGTLSSLAISAASAFRASLRQIGLLPCRRSALSFYGGR